MIIYISFQAIPKGAVTLGHFGAVVSHEGGNDTVLKSLGALKR